jgi:hypothetical protein
MPLPPVSIADLAVCSRTAPASGGRLETDGGTGHAGQRPDYPLFSGDFLTDQWIEDPDEFTVKMQSLSYHRVHHRGEGPDTDPGREANRPTADGHLSHRQVPDYSLWRRMKVLAARGTDIGIAINPDTGNDRGIILRKP